MDNLLEVFFSTVGLAVYLTREIWVCRVNKWSEEHPSDEPLKSEINDGVGFKCVNVRGDCEVEN